MQSAVWVKEVISTIFGYCEEKIQLGTFKFLEILLLASYSQTHAHTHRQSHKQSLYYYYKRQTQTMHAHIIPALNRIKCNYYIIEIQCIQQCYFNKIYCSTQNKNWEQNREIRGRQQSHWKTVRNNNNKNGQSEWIGKGVDFRCAAIIFVVLAVALVVIACACFVVVFVISWGLNCFLSGNERQRGDSSE